MSAARSARVFRPRLLPTLATVAMLALLLGLGRWQLARAEQKRVMVESFERTQTLPVTAYAADQVRFAHVEARGRWDGTHQFLLDAAVHDGQVGFRVLTPLVLADGRVLLVDRGWVAGDPSRRTLPAVALESLDAITTGVLDEFPRAGVALPPGVAVGAADAWPRIVLYPTPVELGAVLGTAVEPLLLRLDAAAANGYARGFAPDFGFPRERHLGYAATWFLLALAVGAIWVVTNLEPRAAAQESH